MNITEKDIGKRVWSITKGWGKITDHYYFKENSYQVRVKFDVLDKNYIYRTNGDRDYGDFYPELYWQEMEVVEKKIPARHVLCYYNTIEAEDINKRDYFIPTTRFHSQDEWESWNKERDEDYIFIRFIDPENP